MRYHRTQYRVGDQRSRFISSEPVLFVLAYTRFYQVALAGMGALYGSRAKTSL